MKRYLKVRGKPGVLVANPYALDASPRRYAGQRRKVNAADFREEFERYEPVEEALVDDRALRKAARAGELEVLSEGTGVSAGKISWIVPPAPEVAPAPQADEPAAAPSSEVAPAAAPAEAPQADEPAGKDS
jgi:hypothetical protein